MEDENGPLLLTTVFWGAEKPVQQGFLVPYVDCPLDVASIVLIRVAAVHHCVCVNHMAVLVPKELHKLCGHVHVLATGLGNKGRVLEVTLVERGREKRPGFYCLHLH